MHFRGAGTFISMSGASARCADRTLHWKKMGHEDTPDPRDSDTVLPPVSENERWGMLRACNVVAAVAVHNENDLPFVPMPEGL